MRNYVDSQAEFFHVLWVYFEFWIPPSSLDTFTNKISVGTLEESKESFYLYFISPKVHLWRMNAMNAFAITIQKSYNYAWWHDQIWNRITQVLVYFVLCFVIFYALLKQTREFLRMKIKLVWGENEKQNYCIGLSIPRIMAKFEAFYAGSLHPA